MEILRKLFKVEKEDFNYEDLDIVELANIDPEEFYARQSKTLRFKSWVTRMFFERYTHRLIKSVVSSEKIKIEADIRAEKEREQHNKDRKEKLKQELLESFNHCKLRFTEHVPDNINREPKKIFANTFEEIVENELVKSYIGKSNNFYRVSLEESCFTSLRIFVEENEGNNWFYIGDVDYLDDEPLKDVPRFEKKIQEQIKNEESEVKLGGWLSESLEFNKPRTEDNKSETLGDFLFDNYGGEMK